MCQYDTDASAQAILTHTQAFCKKKKKKKKKNEVEKRAITLIIIGRFYPKSNLTIFYDYKSIYKIWIQYTNQSF